MRLSQQECSSAAGLNLWHWEVHLGCDQWPGQLIALVWRLRRNHQGAARLGRRGSWRYKTSSFEVQPHPSNAAESKKPMAAELVRLLAGRVRYTFQWVHIEISVAFEGDQENMRIGSARYSQDGHRILRWSLWSSRNPPCVWLRANGVARQQWNSPV
jgi:hypothetical protein